MRTPSSTPSRLVLNFSNICLVATRAKARAFGVPSCFPFPDPLARRPSLSPTRRWTTQKVFHALNFACAVFRASVFAFRRELDARASGPIHHSTWALARDVLLDLPAALFFTTYALLVLFWAEIWYQAKNLSSTRLRPTFVYSNVLVYAVLVIIWTASAADEKLRPLLYVCGSVTLAAASLASALGFLKYGGLLLKMLSRFPPSSKGRRKKLREVGVVTVVCTLSFLIRAGVMVANAARFWANRTRDGDGDGDGDGGFDSSSAFEASPNPGASRFSSLRLDVASRPIVDVSYYVTFELFPTALVLYVLRKLPPSATRADTGTRVPERESAAAVGEDNA